MSAPGHNSNDVPSLRGLLKGETNGFFIIMIQIGSLEPGGCLARDCLRLVGLDELLLF